MVAKGNKDGHNHDYGYVSGRKTVEMEKHGREMARQRYGSLDYGDKPPPQAKDMSQPQRLGDSNNLPGRGYPSDSRMDWKRGANEDATTMPNFDKRRGRA
jgi:hypothetical protein